MKTATLIHAFALCACLSAYLGMSDDVGLSGVRRAIQTIAATVEMPFIANPTIAGAQDAA
jgi:hypothetical protein